MTKTVLFKKESRDKLLVGVKGITDAVKTTMGAAGKCVMIGNGVYGNDGMVQLPTIVTKDGWTVTKHFELTDPAENRGAMLIKEAATKTVEQAGDATTCTCVLAEALITGGAELIDNGANSQLVKKGMDAALKYVVDELKKISTPARGSIERIRQVATVSANNDKEIGNLIAEAFTKIGDDGVIDVEASNGYETTVKTSNGYKFDRGWVSPLFINNKSKESCEFDNPLILLYEKRVTHHTQIERAIQIATHQQKPLLIVCEDSDEEGLAYLAINTARGNIKCCVVKSPEFGDLRREGMEDLALITGGTYISDIRGIDIQKVDSMHFGTAKKVIVTKTETIIIEGGKDSIEFDDFIAELKMNLTRAKTENEKYQIEKRIAQLNGSVAVIQVGAATETELKEKLDRVDDAVMATRAAVAEGFVAGGGTAFLRITAPVDDTVGDFMNGWYLVFKAIESPMKQICLNAGVDADEKLKAVKKATGDFGYNVLTDKVEDMVKAGIIDSTKALRCALINAVSVAGMLLTSDCSIITIH